jgi:hypothetical protein
VLILLFLVHAQRLSLLVSFALRARHQLLDGQTSARSDPLQGNSRSSSRRRRCRVVVWRVWAVGVDRYWREGQNGVVEACVSMQI